MFAHTHARNIFFVVVVSSNVVYCVKISNDNNVSRVNSPKMKPKIRKMKSCEFMLKVLRESKKTTDPIYI